MEDKVQSQGEDGDRTLERLHAGRGVAGACIWVNRVKAMGSGQA